MWSTERLRNDEDAPGDNGVIEISLSRVTRPPYFHPLFPAGRRNSPLSPDLPFPPPEVEDL